MLLQYLYDWYCKYDIFGNQWLSFIKQFIHLSDDFSPHLYYSNEHTNLSSSSPDFSLHLQCRLSGSVMSSSKDTQRSQRRRELDARRSKSRVRLGSCLQSWGQLKEKLGFSLHSELAQHLLERYNTVILFCREIQLPLDPLDDSSLDAHSRIPVELHLQLLILALKMRFFPVVLIQLQIIQGKDRNYEWA